MKINPKIVFILSLILAGCLKSEDNQQCTNGLSLLQDRQIIDSFLQANNQSADFTFDDNYKLYYFIELPGTGSSKPTTDSLVSFRYQGRLLNGTIIDSATVKSPPVIPLRSFSNLVYAPYALSKVSKGGKIQILIPSSSGFGCQQVVGLNIIPSNSQLIYEYELTDMTPSY